MENVTQEHLFSLAFNHSIDRENQLINKYSEYFNEVKNTELKEIIREFEKSSNAHINLLRDKMMKLNLQE